jgi:hypothetical protein
MPTTAYVDSATTGTSPRWTGIGGTFDVETTEYDYVEDPDTGDFVEQEVIVTTTYRLKVIISCGGQVQVGAEAFDPVSGTYESMELGYATYLLGTGGVGTSMTGDCNSKTHSGYQYNVGPYSLLVEIPIRVTFSGNTCCIDGGACTTDCP